MSDKTQITDTINYIVNGVFKEPVTYLNAGTVAISMSDVETAFKITLYIVSIVASILVSRKYLLEIKRLKQQDKQK